jgi:flagellar hook-basal body complex protein FliE
MGITPSILGSLAGAASTAISGSGAPAGGFASALGSAMQKVNDLQTTADQKVTDLLAGNGPDIHSAALSVERASLAFDLMLQVRNKVVGAYQEISRLQF